MIAEQLELEMPLTFAVGERVWWTHGLTYLVATYKKGGKLRPESGEPVTITAIGNDTNPYSGIYATSRTVRVYSQEDNREYSVAPRWLSASQRQPCEAVLEAYEKWGN
jgi:hypothetical protein